MSEESADKPAPFVSIYHSASNDPYAALDLGSNSFHLIVARDNAGTIQIVDRHREMVRLAEGLSDNGTLSDVAIERALDCLGRIGQRLRTLPHHNVYAVGTSALRLAANSESFIKRAEDVLGHNIRIISGREEARLIYSAVSHSIESRQDKRLVIDIGGGSTEVIAGRSFKPVLYESLQIGCINVTERRFKDGKISKHRMKRAVEDCHREFEAVENAYRRYVLTCAALKVSLLALQPLTKEYRNNGCYYINSRRSGSLTTSLIC